MKITFDRSKHVFHSDAFAEIIKDTIRFFNGTPIQHLPPPENFRGTGVPGGENMVKFNDGTVRYFTIAEAKRIQTFPDDYQITGAWSEAMRQLGNAVPVKLAKLVAQSVTCMI